MASLDLNLGKKVISASPQCAAGSTNGWDTAENTSRCTTNIVCSSGNCTVSITNEPMQASCAGNLCNFRFSDGTDVRLLCDGTTRSGNANGVTCATSCVCSLKAAVSSTRSSIATSSPTNNISQNQESGGLSGGAMAGIIIGSLALFLLLLVAGFVLYKRRSADMKPPKDLRDKQTIVVQESTATLDQRNSLMGNQVHGSPTQMSNVPTYYDPNANGPQFGQPQQGQFYANTPQQGYYQPEMYQQQYQPIPGQQFQYAGTPPVVNGQVPPTCLSIPQDSVRQKRTTTPKSSKSVDSNSNNPRPSPRAIGLRSASSKSVLQFEDPDVESRTNSQPEWKTMADISSKSANDFNDQLADQMLSQSRKSKMGEPFTDTSRQDSRITAEYLGNKTNVTTETRKEINDGDYIAINADFKKDSLNSSKMNPGPELKNTVNTTSRKNGSQSALGNIDDSSRPIRKDAEDSRSNLVPLSSEEVKQTEELLEKLYRGEGIPFDAPPDIKFRFERLGPPIYPTGHKPHQTASACPTNGKGRQG